MSTERLELIKKLSDGSFKSREIWLGYDKRISRKIVLEKLKKPCDSSQKECNIRKEDFREAVLQRCSRRHPGIHLCNGLVKDGLLNVYISFECHEGVSLEKWLNAAEQPSENVLACDVARTVFLQLADAVEHLHLLHIVHCAIVPANVYLSSKTRNASLPKSSPTTASDIQVKLANFKEARTVGDPMGFFKNDGEIPTDSFKAILPPFVHKLRPKTRAQSCFYPINAQHNHLESTRDTADVTCSRVFRSKFNPQLSSCPHSSIFVEDTIQPSFDIWCFGAMMFLCVTGIRHWNASCGCFKGRNSLYASIRRIKNRKCRNSSFAAKKRTSKSKAQPEAWNNLTPECQKILARMLSSFPSDRPFITEVLRSDIFLSGSKWKKH